MSVEQLADVPGQLETSRQIRLLDIETPSVPVDLRGKIPFIMSPKGSSRYPNYQFLPPTEVAVEEYRANKARLNGSYKAGTILNLPIDDEYFQQIFGMSKKRGPLNVYNITQPFQASGATFMAGRIQPEGMNLDSKIVIYVQDGNSWANFRTPVYDLEDPFVTELDSGEIIFGGVEVTKNRRGKLKDWRTVFYKGRSVETLEKIAVGPSMMKDIRLKELDDGRFGLFTRPQGEIGARGQIGFTIIDGLKDLTPANMIGAPLISLQFPPYEWGGVNQVIGGEKLLAIAHRAYWDSKGRHYYPWYFTIDPKTRKCQNLGILAERKDFPQGPARAGDLFDVLFTGGVRGKQLYVGVSDIQAGVKEVEIPDLAA